VSDVSPKDIDYSIAAKIFLCSGKAIPAGGMLRAYTSPTGETVNGKMLAEAATAAQIDWLQTGGYIQMWEVEQKRLIGSFKTFGVRANYSGAPGFGGVLLEATGWQDAFLCDMVAALIPLSPDPTRGLISRFADEFRAAGILHGTAWNAEWRDYLVGQYAREAWDTVQRVRERPDYERMRQSIIAGIGFKLEQRDDSDFGSD
jgi:hypothetical protein